MVKEGAALFLFWGEFGAIKEGLKFLLTFVFRLIYDGIGVR
jgi:hypothetical protein